MGLCEEAAAGSEGPWPVAKLFGSLTKLSGVMLDAEDETADLSGYSCAKRFAEEPCVVQLCEGVFGLREEEKAHRQTRCISMLNVVPLLRMKGLRPLRRGEPSLPLEICRLHLRNVV